jgi:hypothetical protein
LGFPLFFSKYDVDSKDWHVDWGLHVHLDVHILIVQRPVLVCRALRAEGNCLLVFALRYPLCDPAFPGVAVGFEFVFLQIITSKTG